ncbi:MAG: hypothetical protein J6D11_02265 [Clostridia bacterium]|nr:hypothetical protein [Clostridia bacterium]
MFKNIKINLKKILAVSLATATLCAAGCGKKELPDFDYAAEDLSSYVTLPDLGSYTREGVVAEYEKAIKEAETPDSYIIGGGSYFDFYVTAYIKNGEDFDKYEKFCHETYGFPVSGYRVLRDSKNADFDKCLMASVVSADEAAVQPRTLKNGKQFSFTLDIGADNTNADIAGKTLKFVITPVSYTAPLYDDAQLNVYTRKYFDGVSNKTTVEAGDGVFLSIIATANGAAIYTNTNAFLFVGENSIFPGFDEYLIGKKAGGSNFSVTFSEDAFTSDNNLFLANGKKVDFYINITKICDTKVLPENENFKTVWELKEYCALESFAKEYLYNAVFSAAKINSYPEDAYAVMEAEMRKQADDVMSSYRKYLEERLGDVSEEYVFDYMQKEIFGEETYDDIEDLIRGVVTGQMDYIIINNVLADELGVEYSYDEYAKDVQALVSSSADYEITVEEFESGMLGGKHYYYAYFLYDKIVEALADKVM